MEESLVIINTIVDYLFLWKNGILIWILYGFVMGCIRWLYKQEKNSERSLHVMGEPK